MRTLWPRLRPPAGGPGKFNTAWVTLTGTGAAASVAFGLLVFASVLASLAIPRESVGLSNGALQRVIAASRLTDRTVIGTVPESDLTDEIGQVQAGDVAGVGASLRARLASAAMSSRDTSDTTPTSPLRSSCASRGSSVSGSILSSMRCKVTEISRAPRRMRSGSPARTGSTPSHTTVVCAT